MSLRDSAPKTTASEKAGLVFSPAGLRSLSKLSGTAYTLANLTIASIVLVVALEWIARGSLRDVGAFLTSPARPGVTTIAAVLALLLALDAILGRRYLSLIAVAPLCALTGLISAQKQTYLSDPLYPSDLLFGRQILELLPTMLKAQPLTAALVVLGLCAAIAALVALWLLARRHSPGLSWRERAAGLVLALPLLAGLASLMDYSHYSWVRDRLNIIPMMWDQQENYRHNGFLMAFAFNIPMANVAAPEGYGDNSIADLTSKSASFAANKGDYPDVIMLMSESLWDPTRLENVELSADPMPTIRAKQSGNVFSPEFGGMTANVEFEALTGFSNAFLPYGSIPYQQYIRRPVPSLASFFRGEGYSAIAMHPFQEWFWNRKQVYKNFGFEEFRSEETLPAMEKRGNFASDDALMNEIMATADTAKNPLFLFAVTLQGHGPYEAARYAENTIDVTGGLSASASQALATYSQGVVEADDALLKLMRWAKKRDRETIIVLFGDHLPPLGQTFVESGYMPGMVASRRAPLEVMKKEHETPLVVWSSKKGVRKNIGTISPALLPYHVLKTAGFSDPFYTGTLGDVQQEFSVIDRHMLVATDGEAMPDWSIAPNAVPDVVRDYRLLQFDMMFGAQYGRERFFPGFNWLHEGAPAV
ncbi:cation tolerance protein CutA [Agrobacterium tumefaciens]|uniref:LTA synthase family protein n=1 Tax=Agrobacterium fabrum TaxID=1176649 RepID=UPI00000D1C26|nr:LTA synthase family protein [Agrobacterium fabrum]KEY50446.1 cation tolerance protein CutA [Agrobacterium tumefaciens]MCX2876225.1 LTA synthase family protein [Agrobacterium fabrum]NMV71672.1 LTA synthase family protein [Agrobacterium fabrum]QQN06955.1 LTA synthase family protein [Agrobacterium fabrum]QQN12021.1 LTA synthase family protein [Agrobacterium fabrum]